MRKFLKTLLLFLAPLLVAVPVLTVVLVQSGELYSFEHHLHPLKERQLFGLAYNNFDQPYKFYMTDSVFRPDVIALGSSRIMQVRREAVSADCTFYNAGGAVQNAYELELFVRSLSCTPRLLIVNIDQWWFNPQYANELQEYNPQIYQKPETNLMILYNKLFFHILQGRIDFRPLFQNSTESIGLTAIEKKSGFRGDGTYCYGDLEEAPQRNPDYRLLRTLGEVERGERKFQYADVPDASVVDAIDGFLRLCQERGMRVVALLPPFAPAVSAAMEESRHFAYLSQLPSLLSPVFAKYADATLYDFTDVSQMPVRNADFVDGFHGSDVVYNCILAQILQQESSLSPYFVDVDKLDSLSEAWRASRLPYHDID